MAFIRNTDRLIEGSSKLFFSNIRAKAAVQSDLDLLASDISAEESARISEDNGMKLRLDVIEGGSAVVGSIAKAQADAQAYADTQIAALVNSAPSVLDTLKELSDALGGDANFATTIAGQIGDVDDKVDQEISDREAAVSALDSRLDSLELDSVTQTYVDGEISSLDSRLDVIEGLDSVEGSVAKAEKDAKDYADSLDSAMDSRVSSLEADPTTKTYVDGIQSALDGRLDVLEGADSVEGSVAKAEKDAKDYTDSKIGDLEGNPDVASFVGALATSVFGAVSAEQSRAEGEEAALDGRLDILEGADTVEGSVAKAEKDAKDYADSLDSTMDSRVSALESDPTTQSYVDGIESALDARLDIIEGLDSVEGSVAKAEKDAKDYADSLDSAMDARVSSLESDPVTKTYVDGEVSSLDSRLDVIEGVGEGSVSKAEQDAKDYADAQIAALVNSAPAVLDTLKELSDALGGDENFATTVSNQIGGLDSRLDVLEGVGEGSVSKAEQDAKDYADSLNSAMDSRVDALELDPVTKTYVDAMTTSDIAEGTNLYYTQGRFDSAFSAKSTSNLSEGSNLYYTQARFDSAFAGKSSTDLAEGSKLFFTDARARSASVVNSSAGSQTDQAMSVSSAKSYIDTADNLRVKLDGTTAMTGALNFSSTLGINQGGASIISAAAGQMLVVSRGMRVPYLGVSGNSTLGAPSSYITGVTSVSSARTITLPAASAMGAGRMLVIKDETGAASSTNYIRIQGSGGQTIDGDAYYDIVVPYESVMIYTNGTNWFII